MWNLDSPEGGLHLRSFQRQEQKIDTLGISKTIQSCQDEEYIRATSRNVKPFKNIRSTKDTLSSVWKFYDFSITRFYVKSFFGILEVRNLPF